VSEGWVEEVGAGDSRGREGGGKGGELVLGVRLGCFRGGGGLEYVYIGKKYYHGVSKDGK